MTDQELEKLQCGDLVRINWPNGLSIPAKVLEVRKSSPNIYAVARVESEYLFGGKGEFASPRVESVQP